MSDEASKVVDGYVRHALKLDVDKWKDMYKLNVQYNIEGVDYLLNIWDELMLIGSALIIELRSKNAYIERVFVAGVVNSKMGVREMTEEEILERGILNANSDLL